MSLAREDRGHALAPGFLDCRQDSDFVVDQYVMARRVTALDLLKLPATAKVILADKEIERGVRELIQLCLQPSDIGEAIERCLKANYERLSLPLPTDVFGMSFEHYRTIICSKHHWPAFEPVLGKNKELISSKLELVRAIRNKIFHFRGDVTVIDHQTLAATRQWLLDKTRSMLQSRKAAQHE